MPDIAKRRRFLLFLVKPSHYDDQGYVIQWWKSALPSNSLACLFGIAQKCMEDQVLGEDVDIEIFPVDETNTRVRPDQIARQIRDNGGFGVEKCRRKDRFDSFEFVERFVRNINGVANAVAAAMR